jgi:membrane protease subunit (stomatin/prohibitin family)
MKIASYNSSSITIINGNGNPARLRLSERFNNGALAESLNPSEKRKAKGMVKTFMGMVYFVSLVYFLFVLLT